MNSTSTPQPTPNRARRLVIMRPPGAGKRTQSTILAEQLEIPALSPGELFRALMTYDTPLAARVRDAVAYGGYVDDEVTNAAIDERLTTDYCVGGFLIYGYPRTLGQMRHLDELLARQQVRLDAVACLHVPDDQLVDRLLARGEALGRVDDREETVQSRLALYHETTEPLLDLYRDRGLLVEIDGTGSPQQVRDQISAAI